MQCHACLRVCQLRQKSPLPQVVPQPVANDGAPRKPSPAWGGWAALGMEPEPERAGGAADVPSHCRLTVHSAAELPSKDWDTRSSDPFVEVREKTRRLLARLLPGVTIPVASMARGGCERACGAVSGRRSRVGPCGLNVGLTWMGPADESHRRRSIQKERLSGQVREARDLCQEEEPEPRVEPARGLRCVRRAWPCSVPHHQRLSCPDYT